MPPDDTDQLIDDLFPPEDEETTEEETEEEPKAKEKEEKPEPKAKEKEEKPEAKPLASIPPDADAAEVAWKAGEIVSDMRTELTEKFGHQLTPKEINKVLSDIKTYGVRAMPGLFNANFHIKSGHVAVGEKRDAGLLDETAKPKRETFSPGGGAPKGGGKKTKGDDILNRIVGRDGKPDPKIKEFFASKGMKV